MDDLAAKPFGSLATDVAVSFFSGLVTGTGGSLRDKGL